MDLLFVDHVMKIENKKFIYEVTDFCFDKIGIRKSSTNKENDYVVYGFLFNLRSKISILISPLFNHSLTYNKFSRCQCK